MSSSRHSPVSLPLRLGDGGGQVGFLLLQFVDGLLILRGFLVVGLAADGGRVDFSLDGQLPCLDVVIELVGGPFREGLGPLHAAAADRLQPLESKTRTSPMATIGRPAKRQKRLRSEFGPKDSFHRDGPLAAAADLPRLPSGTTNDSLHAGHWIR